MGVGIGSVVDALGHALRGPANVFDHVISTTGPDGKTKFIVVSHTDTIKTALRGTGEMSYPEMLNDPKMVKDFRIKRDELKPLGSWDDAPHSDTHMIVPTNREGHVVFKDGRVYNRKAKKYLHRSGEDTDIVGYAKIEPSLGRRLKWIMASPSVLIRLAIISAIGLLVDLFACYQAYRKGERKGEKRGYRKALMGQVPVGSASNNSGFFGPNSASGSHSSGTGSFLASYFSPFPMALQPLSNTQYAYPNPQLSAQIQQTAATNWIKRHVSPPPCQATPPYPPPPYQASASYSTYPTYPPPAYQATQQPPAQQQLVA